ncbi:hypothetical protein BG015_007408 [Linnemannia schmuckeri]|uniref:Up-regulated during septation protein 1 domain-containing protein n=1 Tax=Linnemannia schmuckeri TaxID=64567 RepID=A0A9P5VBC1_9FUNG|nr:hypothetical protein BG015_007408 [Linnemannia schmuckeri]
MTASSKTLLSPYNHSSYSQSSDSLVHALPTRKISSSSFIKLARQASDTAFRSVGLNRKQSDHNLREQAAAAATAAAASTQNGGGVYEQNPKVYLYQQQQQQHYLHQHVKTRPHHHPLRPQSDDTVPEEWAMNNQLLHTETCGSDDYYDPPPIVKPFASRSLRRNISMPDMKDTEAATVAQTSCERRPSRANSPQPPAAAAHQVERSRSRSRPQVQPHHFTTTAIANSNSSEPTAVTSSTNSACEPALPKSTTLIPASSGDERSNIQRKPSRPPRNQNHTSPHYQNNNKAYQQHQNQMEQQRHHEQQCQRLLTRQQVLSDESLPEYGDAMLSVSLLDGSINSINNKLSNISSKDLPPTPPGPPPSFSLPTRSRRRTESNSESDSGTSPTGSLAPVLPAIGTSLTRNGSSNGGIIPQDVLRSMDPKDVQKAVSSTVIASRVYKVLNPEQLESLKKEQEGLKQFVEAMNVSLHIETRMRDASCSLIRLHESNLNNDAVKAANSQLHATTSKMDQIVQKSQQAMWRLLAIQRLLLQHETAVLNAGLRRLDNENRDLSRAVMNLETARGQEKEEKLRWKKEHTRLKVQSILVAPTSPIVAASEVAVPPTPQLQLVQEQLSAMENYAKELSEDVLQKDEKLGELRNELGAVRGWADDFEASLRQQADKKTITSPAETATAAEKTLQEQLRRLQSTIEADYKDFHVHADELQVKVNQLTEENLTLVTTAAAPCKCSSDDDISSSSASSSHSSLELTEQQQQEHQASRSWRIRPGFTSSRESTELHNVLRESLWQLDRQIELDERLSSTSSGRSSASSSCRNSSASTVSSAFSIDNATGSGKHGGESPLIISRRSSSRSNASSSSATCGGGRLSRTSSTSSSSKFGLREHVLMRDMTSSPETVTLGLGQVVECEDVGEEDEVEDKEGLDAIVKEIEQIVMHQQQE